jgi:hypothetical protein
MMTFGLALIAFALILIEARAEPIVLIDHEWNVRYAKFACERAKAACAKDPTLEVHLFEARVTTAAAVNPLCKGSRVVKLVVGRKVDNPMNEPLWFLKIDDWHLGAARQLWKLNLAGSPRIYEGEGDANAIASDVCAIVTNGGATAPRGSDAAMAIGEAVQFKSVRQSNTVMAQIRLSSL